MKENIAPAVPSIVYNTFWRFAAERQNIFYRRLHDHSPPWTEDTVLRRHKFTNVYRAADRVSQFLIRHVIYSGPQDPDNLLFRILLFKLFNRINTWKRLRRRLGDIILNEVDFTSIDNILTDLQDDGIPIYSAAYIMPSPQTFGHSRKHRNHLALLQSMLSDGLPRRIASATEMKQVFCLLRSYPSLGDFLAYQFTIDINYSTLTTFSEMDFVVPGPGAESGIAKCFKRLGGLTESEVIRLMTDRQHQEFDRLGISFQDLWGRPLQLIDIQNLFCEVDKYSRLAHPDIKRGSNRDTIKQIYSGPRDPIDYMFPPDWGINTRMTNTDGA